MTPLHYSIKAKLLPICLEINAKAREQLKPSDPAKAKRAKELNKAFDMICPRAGIAKTSATDNYVRACLAVVLDLPELASKSEIYFQPLSILRDLASEDPKFSFLVLHGEKKVGMDIYGGGLEYSSRSLPATDEEIESCLDNLTADQLKYILRSPIFEPFLADLFEQTTELIPADEENIPF